LNNLPSHSQFPSNRTLPPMRMMIELSRLLAAYGLDVRICPSIDPPSAQIHHRVVRMLFDQHAAQQGNHSLQPIVC